MIYVRGNAADYDRWAQMGNPGWSYAEVLPYFPASRRPMPQRRDDFHGDDGPLSVTPRARARTRCSIASSRRASRPATHGTTTSTAPSQDGFGRYDFTIRNGKRQQHVAGLPPPGAAADATSPSSPRR